MAESKKTSEKTNRSSGPSTTVKPKDEVIKGAAVEKPTAAKSARPMDEPAKPQKQLPPGQDHRQSTIRASQSVAIVLAGVAVVVALIALAVSVVTYQQTADETAFGQPAAGAPMHLGGQADLDKLRQRLDSLD